MTERPNPTRSWTARSRRSLLARFSTAHGLMVLAGLLTFVLVVSATKGSDARLAVAVATNDIPAGAAVGAGLLRRVELPAGAELARSTVPWNGIGAGDRVTARPIAAGEFLRPSDLVPAAGSGRAQLRAMSIPVKAERAVGGTLRVGDRVDVVDVVDGSPRWVVTGAQVIEVPSAPSARGIVRDAGAAYHVVVEVDAVQALALAQALSHDNVSVIRSTGAPPPPPVFSGFSGLSNPSQANPSTQPTGGQTPAPAPGS
ncbi:MAG: SAF domain-containing protein [Actinomycetota bacterium]